MNERRDLLPQECAGGARHPSDRQPEFLADPGASLSSSIESSGSVELLDADDWIETDLYLAALIAASVSSPSPETPSHALDVPGGSSGFLRTSDSARQGVVCSSVQGDTAPEDAPGCGSSPGFTWSTRLRRKLLARRRRPS
jgi:hypothetical protein